MKLLKKGTGGCCWQIGSRNFVIPSLEKIVLDSTSKSLGAIILGTAGYNLALTLNELNLINQYIPLTLNYLTRVEIKDTVPDLFSLVGIFYGFKSSGIKFKKNSLDLEKKTKITDYLILPMKF